MTLILRRDKVTRGVFQGVYPSDHLPASVSHYPSLFITTVDTSDKPGSHWMASYFTKEQEGEFFDSYGSPRSKYVVFKKVVNVPDVLSSRLLIL